MNHCKFPILQQSTKTVVLIAGHQPASSWQGRHGAGAPQTWQLATSSHYILPILVLSCNVSWIQNFYPLPALDTMPCSLTAAGFCPTCQGIPPWIKWWLTKVCPVREKGCENILESNGSRRKEAPQPQSLITWASSHPLYSSRPSHPCCRDVSVFTFILSVVSPCIALGLLPSTE